MSKLHKKPLKVVAAGAASLLLMGTSILGVNYANALQHTTVANQTMGGANTYTLTNRDTPAGLTFTAERRANRDCVVTWTGLPADTKALKLNIADTGRGQWVAQNLEPTVNGSINLGPDMKASSFEIESRLNGWHSSGIQNKKSSCVAWSINTPNPGNDNLVDTMSGDVNVTGTLSNGAGGGVLITKGKDASNYVGARVNNQTYIDAGTKSTYQTRSDYYTYKYDYGYNEYQYITKRAGSRTCYTGKTGPGTGGVVTIVTAPAPTYYHSYSTFSPRCGADGAGSYDLPTKATGTSGDGSSSNCASGVSGDCWRLYTNMNIEALTDVETWSTEYSSWSATPCTIGVNGCTSRWKSDVRPISFCSTSDSKCHRSGPYLTGWTTVGVRSTTGTQGDYGDTCTAGRYCRVIPTPYSNTTVKYSVDFGEKIGGNWHTRRTYTMNNGVTVTSVSLRNRGSNVSLYVNGLPQGSYNFSQIGSDSTLAGTSWDASSSNVGYRSGSWTGFTVVSNAA